MSRISVAELERLKSLDLVRLVASDGLVLKRIGKDLACACPFHEGDREPSLVVSPASNLFHCFGCGNAPPAQRVLATSQLPLKLWHSQFTVPTLADAILDRLVHNAELVELTGESMRKKGNKPATGEDKADPAN